MEISIESVGVLVTLVYLAIELRANNRIAKSNGHRDIVKQHTTWYSLHRNSETAVILAKGALNFSELEPGENSKKNQLRSRVC